MKEIDKVFKALADPSRRKLLDRLHAKNGQTLRELCAGLVMARQSVTQHLGLLEDANLISVQWHGREKLHYFNPVPIHEIYERWIRKFERERLDVLHNLKTKLERK
ncbi:MAG: ArsR/SmtB family transcription factor [Sulfuricaulis sp.]